MKADVLSRKDQVNTTEDNKNVQLLKKKIWIRKIMIAEVKIIQRNQVVEETTLLNKIRRNQTKEKKVQKELEKDEGQA